MKMTYIEKVAAENPEESIDDIAVKDCPSDYGLDNIEDCPFYGGKARCAECWNREIKEDV